MSTLVQLLADRSWPDTFERAVRGGAAADRVGYAFAAGYQAAVHALVPDLPDDVVASLAASEAGGAHPRAIATQLVPVPRGGFLLRGSKTFATQGPDASVFLVLATLGNDRDGLARLRLASVQRGARGLTLEPGPETPFCPEIGHAQPRFDDVPLAESAILPGDGWTDRVKPFRTIEDVHVHAAVLAYVLGVATRHAWPAAALEELAALLVGLGALVVRPVAAPATHVALAGAIALARRTLAAQAPLWDSVRPEERGRWVRDQPLLQVAEKARTARTQAAWDDLRSG